MSRLGQGLIIAGLVAAIALSAAYITWKLGDSGMLRPGPSLPTSGASAPAAPPPPPLSDNEIRTLAAQAGQFRYSAGNPAYARLKTEWRRRFDAGRVTPEQFLAWRGLCVTVQDAPEVREFDRRAWTVLVERRTPKEVPLADLAQALEAGGNPALDARHPWRARVREVLAVRLEPGLDAASLNRWVAIRSSLPDLRADDNEARLLLGVIAEQQFRPSDLTEATCRSAGRMLQTPRGQELLAAGMDDETGAVNVAVAKVSAWERFFSSNSRDDQAVLRRYVAGLEQRIRAGLRGDAEAMCRLAIAYGVTLIRAERTRRCPAEGDYSGALAAAQSGDMVMVCLEEICQTARDVHSYDFALRCLESSSERLNPAQRERAGVLAKELSSLKAALPPPKPAAPKPPPSTRPSPRHPAGEPVFPSGARPPAPPSRQAPR